MTASPAEVFGDAFRAVESSFRKTITIDEEFVIKSKKASTGRLRERRLEREMKNAVNVWRHI